MNGFAKAGCQKQEPGFHRQRDGVSKDRGASQLKQVGSQAKVWNNVFSLWTVDTVGLRPREAGTKPRAAWALALGWPGDPSLELLLNWEDRADFWGAEVADGADQRGRPCGESSGQL